MKLKLAVGAMAALLALSPATADAQSPQVTDAINHASDSNDLNRSFMWCLARRESGYNPNAFGLGLFHGLYQYLLKTWHNQSWKYGFGGWSVYNAWANANVTGMTIRDMRYSPRRWSLLYGQWPPAQACGNPWAWA